MEVLHVEQVLQDVMRSCLNVPYVWGGNNPLQGLDCSGFVLWCLRSVGLWTAGDMNAQGLYKHFKVTGTVMDIKADDLPVGTLCFYGESLQQITHVAMIYENDLIIEAGGGGSKCKTPADAAAAGAMVRIRPLLTRRDLLALISP